MTRIRNPKLQISVAKKRRAFIVDKIRKTNRELKRMNLELKRLTDEREWYDQIIESFRTDYKPLTSKQMAEEILKEIRRAMRPQEIYEEMVRKGYKGNAEDIYLRLYRWLKAGNTSIKRINHGQYVDASLLHRDQKLIDEIRVLNKRINADRNSFLHNH